MAKPKQRVTGRVSGGGGGSSSSGKSNGSGSGSASPSSSTPFRTPEVPPTSSQGVSDPSTNVVSTASDLDRKANELVQYLLIADQKKNPIRKQDINSHVLKEHRKQFPAVLEKAREMLSNVFGMDLIELDGKMKGRYILVNKHKVHGDEGVTSSSEGVTSPSSDRRDDVKIYGDEEAAKLGLLFNILAMIYMNGDIISDAELWKALRKLGVDHDCRHEVFGDVRKLVVDEFVKEAYLEYVKQPNSEPPSYQFHWGQRAHRELRKKDVLIYVSKVYGTEPTEWKTLWQECIAEEEKEQGHSSSQMEQETSSS